MVDDFYVVDVPDTSIVLGVQWLYSIGKYSTNYQTLEMEFLAPDGKRVVLRGMPNGASGSATAKGMTTIVRHEDKTRTRNWSTPTRKTSRKDQRYEKGFSSRPPDKSMMCPREFRRGSKSRMFNPHRYPRRYKEGIQSMGEKKHKIEGKEEPPSSGINWLIKMDKRQGQMIRYIGQRLLEDKQFREVRTIMPPSKP